MKNKVEFTNNTTKVNERLEKMAIAWLYEAKSSISAQASRNSPVKSGELKRSFEVDSKVDESELTARIGSSLEYAAWQEQGTGEYALEGNGRKGGWVYIDPETGKTVFTRGIYPKRMLYTAFLKKKAKVKKRAQEIFKG